MGDINSNGLPAIPRWRRGEPISARKLNTAVDAINRVGRSIGQPYQVIRQPVPTSGGSTTQMRYKSMGQDHIVCRTWDGLEEGSDDINVAKPFKLRRTPFDNETYNGIDYVYSSNTERVASTDDDEETQIIHDEYVEDDIIYATQPVGGTGVLDNGEEGEDVLWLDTNADARCWVRRAPE